MKRKDLELTVYWKKRKETLRKCTQDFLSFLHKLKTYHPTFFGTWYGEGRSKKEIHGLSKRICIVFFILFIFAHTGTYCMQKLVS